MPGFKGDRLEIFIPSRGNVEVIGVGFGGGEFTVTFEYTRPSDRDTGRESFELETLGLDEVNTEKLRNAYADFFEEYGG